MRRIYKERISRGIAVILVIIALSLLGVGVGVAVNFATVRNTLEQLDNTENALPTTVLDRNGRLISQFYSEERRDPVELHQMPDHLIHAILTREDQTFYRHRGFSFRGTFRALWNLIINRYVSGGSTITQQLAGHFFADRREFSIGRKLRELWWALQFERYWTKDQILEKYLNTMFFGHGAYGVQAASQFYFSHSVSELTPAESAMLVIQLANPSRYSPIRNPNQARKIQETVLEQMVDLGYLSSERADASLADFWNRYDYTRSSASAAFFERNDNAPYFSEYIRFLLENEYLLGSVDINRDGYTIHTTLDLDYQKKAEERMRAGIEQANRIYRRNDSNSTIYGRDVVAITELLSVAFDISGFKDGGSAAIRTALINYRENIINPIDIVALLFGRDNNELLRQVSAQSQRLIEDNERRTTVEGALIAVENGSGHILAMVGGSKFESRNQFNRAVNGRVEPGSAFKPLYYAAAIEDRVITPATLIYDAPVIFWNDDGTPYTPQNYRGEWKGKVFARQALARSMNVPSLRILERVGFSSALETARLLLGIPAGDMIERNLVRRYPVGLGVVEVSPLEMARAFSVFPNKGSVVEPLAVRYITDRNGRVISEPEKKHLRAIHANPQSVISEQTAYIMANMLQSTTRSGTLAYAVGNAQPPDGIAIAGKTGTTQNWADAWTVGFTPYVTSAVWFGFDKGGFNSLGTNQTGAVTAGPVWAQFMRDIHSGLPPRSFARPQQGITWQTVTANNGLLPPADYAGRVLDEVFLVGTTPTEFDVSSSVENYRQASLEDRLYNSLYGNSAESSEPLIIVNENSIDSEQTLYLDDEYDEYNEYNEDDEYQEDELLN